MVAINEVNTIDNVQAINSIIDSLEMESGKRISNRDTFERWISQIEFDETTGDVDWRQEPIKKIAKALNDANPANVAKWISTGIISSPIMEKNLKKVKRKWTDDYPAVYINPAAVMRNKIVKFIGDKDKHRCPWSELKNFMSSLEEDEEVGREPNKNYINSNKKIFSKIKVGKTPYVKLTKVGKRIYKHICEEEKVNLNETDITGKICGIFGRGGSNKSIMEDGKISFMFEKRISEEEAGKFIYEMVRELFDMNVSEDNFKILEEDSDDTDINTKVKGVPKNPKKNKRVGGIEFHPPIHNSPDAPAAASDAPAGVGEANDGDDFSDLVGKGIQTDIGLDVIDEITVQKKYKVQTENGATYLMTAEELKNLRNEIKERDQDKEDDISPGEVPPDKLPAEGGEEVEEEPVAEIKKGIYKGRSGVILSEKRNKKLLRVVNEKGHKVYTGWFKESYLKESDTPKELYLNPEMVNDQIISKLSDEEVKEIYTDLGGEDSVSREEMVSYIMSMMD